MKMKYFFINDYVIDIDVYSTATINGFLQQELDKRFGTGKMAFNYRKTRQGYQFTLIRQENYAVTGNVLSDRDCALLTGLPVTDFQLDLQQPFGPLVSAFPFGNAFYVPAAEFERIYATMIGACPGAAKPRSVRVSANSAFISVEVRF